jgi:hypothetical protein
MGTRSYSSGDRTALITLSGALAHGPTAKSLSFDESTMNMS